MVSYDGESFSNQSKVLVSMAVLFAQTFLILIYLDLDPDIAKFGENPYEGTCHQTNTEYKEIHTNMVIHVICHHNADKSFELKNDISCV